jgi:uncharacterized OB-fold protein
MSEGRRARPQPTPETQHFWDGTREGQLRLQRCNACGKAYFPPRPFCPACAARDVAVFAASGKGRLYSYVIHHRPVPGFTPPYAIAVVELDEGPRMMTTSPAARRPRRRWSSTCRSKSPSRSSTTRSPSPSSARLTIDRHHTRIVIARSRRRRSNFDGMESPPARDCFASLAMTASISRERLPR